MVGEFVFAAIGPYYGGSIQSILQQWEQIGVFAYLLPFLMIFALIFVILNSIKIFKDNRGVNAVIAIAVGLMALQFQFVPFQQLHKSAGTLFHLRNEARWNLLAF